MVMNNILFPVQVLDVGDKNEQLSHTPADIKKYRQSLLIAERVRMLY